MMHFIGGDRTFEIAVLILLLSGADGIQLFRTAKRFFAEMVAIVLVILINQVVSFVRNEDCLDSGELA